MRAILAALLLTATMVLTGCIELTGQRFSFHHDAPEDTMHVLIFYDGIHNSDNQNTGDADAQRSLARAIEDDRIMLLDWIGVIDLPALIGRLDEADREATRNLARQLRRIRVEPIATYRLPNGHIGGVQRVTIPEVSRLLTAVNRWIDHQGGEAFPIYLFGQADMPRTVDRIAAATREGHDWLSIEDHTLRFSVPVHRREWLAAKDRALRGLAEQLIQITPEQWSDSRQRQLNRSVAFLAQSNITLIERADGVTFQLGVAGDPADQFRIRIRPDKVYEDNLAQTLTDSIPDDLHTLLVVAMSEHEANPAKDIPPHHLLAMAPPEHLAWALFLEAEGNDSDWAADRLGTWAENWNDQHGHPEAPTDPGDRPGWEAWFAAMRYFPLDEASGESDDRPEDPAESSEADG